MLCAQVMKTEVARCPETLSVKACAAMMRDHNIGFMPVVDTERRVLGVITDRDLAVRVLSAGLSPDTPVGEVMTRDVRVCHSADTLEEAEWKLAATRKSRLVVVDNDGRCLGVISLSDVAQAEAPYRTGNLLRAVTRREARLQVGLP